MTGVRVLLVDDDRDVRETVASRLRQEQFEVISCTYFIEAADHLHAHFEGVVVSDFRMPGKDGLWLLNHCRSVDPELPVIMLTGYADRRFIIDAISLGAVTVLEKPCSMKTLIAEIRAANDRRLSRLEARSRRAKRQLRSWIGKTPEDVSLSVQMQMIEKTLIEKSLKRHGGDIENVTKELNLSKSTLYERMRRAGIDPKKFR